MTGCNTQPVRKMRGSRITAILNESSAITGRSVAPSSCNLVYTRLVKHTRSSIDFANNLFLAANLFNFCFSMRICRYFCSLIYFASINVKDKKSIAKKKKIVRDVKSIILFITVDSYFSLKLNPGTIHIVYGRPIHASERD
jgi:hypothetical protein